MEAIGIHVTASAVSDTERPDPYVGYQTADGLAIAYVQSVVGHPRYTFTPAARDQPGRHSEPSPRVAFPVLTIVSRNTWFLNDLGQNATEARLRVTHDSGATWHSVSAVPDPYPGNTSVTFAFVDTNHGWTSTRTSACLSGKTQCGSSDHLYATTDGGITWSVLSVPGPASS